MTEKVLVFPKYLLYGFEGFNLEPGKEESGIVSLVSTETAKHNKMWLNYIMGHASYLYRSAAEKDENFLQVIPYGVLIHDDKIFTYERNGTENRLLKFRSLGIGGHMNIVDNKEYIMGLMREVREELWYDKKLFSSLLKDQKANIKVYRDQYHFEVHPSLLYDVGSEVSRVHFGIVIPLSIEMQDFKPELLDLSYEGKKSKWVTSEEIKKERDKYEPWSRLVIDTLK